MLLESFIKLFIQSSFSYQNWAIHLSECIQSPVSKQAIFKRIDDSFLKFLQLVLAHCLCDNLSTSLYHKTELFKAFKNVYLHDSTHYRLAQHLHKHFPGNFTKGCQRAVLKIQTVFNITKGAFSFFQITHFTDPDIASVSTVNDLLCEGDLIIRDLGYFSFHCFEQIIKRKAYFLSRFKLHIPVFDPRSGNRINLPRLLNNQLCVDRILLVGAERKLKVRLVAQRLPAAIANERRRKARANRNNPRTNHSNAYYELLGFAIFITNVESDTWSAQQVAKAYRCRWYIETVFKSWKSHLPSCYQAPDRYARKLTVEIHFYLLLIYVSTIIMPVLQKLNHKRLRQNSQPQFSLLKLCSFITIQWNTIRNYKSWKALSSIASYYCIYDRRTNRNNLTELIYQALS